LQANRIVARKFVELCNQGENVDAMGTMYVPDIVSVQGDKITREQFLHDEDR
jgi:hypothetical protein